MSVTKIIDKDQVQHDINDARIGQPTAEDVGKSLTVGEDGQLEWAEGGTTSTLIDLTDKGVNVTVKDLLDAIGWDDDIRNFSMSLMVKVKSNEGSYEHEIVFKGLFVGSYGYPMGQLTYYLNCYMPVFGSDEVSYSQTIYRWSYRAADTSASTLMSAYSQSSHVDMAQLPSDSWQKTYEPKAVNGVMQWQESEAVPTPELVDFSTDASSTILQELVNHFDGNLPTDKLVDVKYKYIDAPHHADWTYDLIGKLTITYSGSSYNVRFDGKIEKDGKSDEIRIHIDNKYNGSVDLSQTIYDFVNAEGYKVQYIKNDATGSYHQMNFLGQMIAEDEGIHMFQGNLVPNATSADEGKVPTVNASGQYELKDFEEKPTEIDLTSFENPSYQDLHDAVAAAGLDANSTNYVKIAYIGPSHLTTYAIGWLHSTQSPANLQWDFIMTYAKIIKGQMCLGRVQYNYGEAGKLTDRLYETYDFPLERIQPLWGDADLWNYAHNKDSAKTYVCKLVNSKPTWVEETTPSGGGVTQTVVKRSATQSELDTLNAGDKGFITAIDITYVINGNIVLVDVKVNVSGSFQEMSNVVVSFDIGSNIELESQMLKLNAIGDSSDITISAKDSAPYNSIRIGQKHTSGGAAGAQMHTMFIGMLKASA